MTVTKPCPVTSVPVVKQASDAQPQVPIVPSETPTPAPKAPAPEAPAPAPKAPVPEAPVPKAPAPETPAPKAPAPKAPAPEPPTPAVTSSSSTTVVAAASTPTSGLKACAQDGALAITLEDGILKDQKGRTGYIAANYQFQFDGPPQAGALYTSGFTLCNNGSLALGGSNVFYQCLSGDFYNLYDRYWAAQCSPVTINPIILEKC